MRDYILVLAVLIGLGATFVNPFAGVLLWTWISVQNPHEEVYSFARSLQLNLATALVTILVWLLSRERKMPPSTVLVWVMLIFLAWATFNSFFAFSPDYSWPYWDRTWKVFALGILITVLATNAVRVHAVVWIVVLSLFYYGVKGGIFTVMTGGQFHVVGPPHSIIGDNNQLALALLMSLPLANYLRQQSTNRFMRAGLMGGIALTLISIVGSYSRGALLALGVLAAVGLLRSRRKLLYLSLAAIGIFFVVRFMPQAFWDRAQTIQTAADTDASFQGRLMAWQVAYRYAVDHFPFGAGFYGTQLSEIFNAYFPGETAHAAHSIYFQVLGENGFIGLFLYLAIIAGAFLKSSAIIRRTRRHPEFEWAGELARMVQLSLIAFCVGGAALSMAYYDVFIICVALLVSLDELTSEAHPLALRLPQPFLANTPQTVHALEPSLSGAPGSIHEPHPLDSDFHMP